MVLEEVDVVAEEVAGRLELLELGEHARASLVLGATRLVLGLGIGTAGGVVGLGEQARRFVLRGGEGVGRTLLGLADRGVGGALGEHEGALQRLVGVVGPPGPVVALVGAALCLERPLLGGGHPLPGLPHLGVLPVDRDGQSLQELVDVLRVVAPALGLAELDVVQHLRSHVHPFDRSQEARRVEAAPVIIDRSSPSGAGGRGAR